MNYFKQFLVICFVLIIITFIHAFYNVKYITANIAINTSSENSISTKIESNQLIQKTEEYYNLIYYPEGEPTPMKKYLLSEQINQDNSDLLAVNSWKLLGPSGFHVLNDPNLYWSGRALDIEVNGVPSIRVATASGGLWKGAFLFPVSISDHLNASTRIGSFCSKPNDPNTILVGTGENIWGGVTGAGLFKTTNEGATYSQVPMSPNPTAFYKIRFAPGSNTVVHAGAGSGYYKSTDAGDSWSQYIDSFRVSDIAIDPSNTNRIYATVWDSLQGGFYKSTNGGITWTKITTGGIPAVNIGRCSIGLSPSNPAIIYVNMTKWSDSKTLGVYKTTNSGSTWTNVTPNPSFHGNQGFHNCVSVIHPTNANLVFIGGVTLWRTTNGSTSWTEINGFHGDYQELVWTSNGVTLYVCSDGGVGTTSDNGATWNTSFNHFPVTQIAGFDISPNGNYCFGGTQDNGIIGTTDRGINWYMRYGGDGGFASIFPNLNSTIAVTSNGGGAGFPPKLSTNSGLSWTVIANGITLTEQGFTQIRNDKRSSPYLYHNNGKYVYRSLNSGTSWSKLNSTAFSCEQVNDISVPKYNSNPGPTVYACLYNNPADTNKIMRYISGTWTNISAGLPLSRNVVKVAAWDANNIVIYCLLSGSLNGQKVYRSFNRGGVWGNITNDLPNVTVTDIAPHPTDIYTLYLSTMTGCYKTTNAGTNWHRWNNGMPSATEVRELRILDSTAQNGKAYVAACTWGRSVYYRDGSGDDPIGIKILSGKIPGTFRLYQNYPNPFNPSTNIRFDISPQKGAEGLGVFTVLKIYDITGKVIAALVNTELKPGKYEISFDASNFAGGIYFYNLRAGTFVNTKKMIFIK